MKHPEWNMNVNKMFESIAVCIIPERKRDIWKKNASYMQFTFNKLTILMEIGWHGSMIGKMMDSFIA